MEDKTFELLEKMYSEITTRFEKVDSRFDKMDSRLDKVENKLGKVEAGQVKLETILEHDIKDKLQALHEREAANSEKLEEHGKQLDLINKKLDYLSLTVNSHDIKLNALESLKKAR